MSDMLLLFVTLITYSLLRSESPDNISVYKYAAPSEQRITTISATYFRPASSYGDM